MQLRDIIKRRGKRQLDIADLLGLSEGQTSKLIRKPGEITLARLETIANFLECRVSDLTGETKLDAADLRTSNRRSREAIKAELDRIDKVSVRLLREFAVTLDNAPDGLVRLEAFADELRAELQTAI